MDSDEEYEQQKKKEREETEKEEEEEKNGPWKGVCFDDGTGRNIVYYDFKTKTKTRHPPPNYVVEKFENGNRRYYSRGQCIRCRTNAPSVFFTIQNGQYGLSPNYCEKCLLDLTLGVSRIKGNGDKIWEINHDIPCNTYINLERSLLDPNRDEIINQRTREASFAVRTTAKHYRNLDRQRNMKIMALQQDIFEGKLVSWGFGTKFDEYFGLVDSNGRPHAKKGMKIYSDGSVYIGGWVRGNRHQVEGNATWTRPDGTQYIGTFMNDAKHGHGKYTYPDGGTYVGEFAQGFEHGQGVRVYADGNRYEGRFRYGKRDGPGTMFYTMGTVEKGIFKDTESFHEALIPKIEEDDSSETVTTVIFEPESLLTLAIKAVAKTMKFNRSLLPNSLVLRRLQPFFKPIVAREYLSKLNPVGSKLFLEEAPKIAFQELPTISLNYVKFLYYDMESFLYFTTMSSKIVRLELSNNRLDPTSLDMINTQISNGIWPKIRYLDFSFNKIDTTGLQNFFLAVARGIEQIEFIKLSGCNITSTSAQSVAKFIESTNTLQELDISFNAIQAIGIEHIARALTVNTSLVSLNVRQNNIGVVGGECLVKAMQSNFTLRELVVADNKISREISVALAGRLRGSTRDVFNSFRSDQLTLPAVHKEREAKRYH